MALIGLTPWLIVVLLIASIAGLALYRVGDRRLWLLTPLALTWIGYLAAVAPTAGLNRCLAGPPSAGINAAAAAASPSASTSTTTSTSAFTSTITVYSHNVLLDGAAPAALAANIIEANPDVIVLQEASLAVQRALQAEPQLDFLAHRASAGVGPLGGLLVWSRWPMTEQRKVDFVVSDAVEATIDGPAGRFTVTNIHTLAPYRSDHIETWKDQFDVLTQLDLDEPRVLAGDFNATKHHRPMRQLLDMGWTNASLAPACGSGATWPAAHTPIPFPLLQLDHQLTTNHFEPLRVELGDAAGSDHRPLVVAYEFDDQA